jgi:hypothetical protein
MNHDTMPTNQTRDSAAPEVVNASANGANLNGAGTPPPDVFPDFAISLEEANRRVKMLQEFVREHMVEGEDYGVIPGTSGKPTLFKPGAEKLNAIFGLAPIVEITSRDEDWDAGRVAYEVKVTLLNKRTTSVEAEGIGNCKSRERRYKNQDAANIANTILKMAKKRALIDATLSATRASGLFTQDLEDMDLERTEKQEHERHERNAIASYSRGENQNPFHGSNAHGSNAHGSNGDARAQNGSQNGNAPSATRDNAPREMPQDAAPQDAAPRAANSFRPAVPSSSGSQEGATNNPNVLTEAQRGAILAIANKAFGRNTKDEMARLTDKPISQLSKAEASALIDKLRALLPEQPQASHAERNGAAR